MARHPGIGDTCVRSLFSPSDVFGQLSQKKMMVRPVVGCGGWHDVSIVSIFLWVVGVAKLQILAILSNDPCNLGCKLT